MDFLELIKKIPLFYKFLNEFASFWKLPKLARLGSLLYNVKSRLDIFKDEYKGKQERLNSVFEAVELVLAYKKEHPQDFEDFCDAIEGFCQKRKNDKSIDEDIISLMK